MDYSDHSIGLSTTSVDGLPQSFSSVESLPPASSTFGADPEHVDGFDVNEDLVAPSAEPDAVAARPSFLRLVPALQGSASPIVFVPPTAIDLNTQMTFQDLSRVRTQEDLSRVRAQEDLSRVRAQEDLSRVRMQEDLSRAQTPQDLSRVQTSQELSGESGVSNLFGEVSDAEFPEVSANHPARSMQAHPTASKSATVTLASTPKSPRTLRTLAALSSHPFTPRTDELGLPIVGAKQPDALPKQQAPGRSRSFERRRPGSVGGVRAAVARSSHPALAFPDTPNSTNSTNSIQGDSIQAKRALMNPSGDILPSVQPFFGAEIEQRDCRSVSGVRISTRTVRNAGTQQRQTILDLREAEAQQPVRRRPPNQQAQRSQSPDSQPPLGASANTSYFAGHEYELDCRQSSTLGRFGDRLSPGLPVRGTPAVRLQRDSLRRRIQERTGLSPAVVGGIGVGMVSAVGIGLLFSPLFALHHIDVRRAGSTRAKISTATELRIGEPLISLDVSAIQRRVAALPEVSAAKVERKWPRGIRITVATRIPVVVLAHSGRLALVATDGTVLQDFSAVNSTNGKNGTTSLNSLVSDGVSYTPIVAGAIAPVGQPVTGDAQRVVDLMTALDSGLRDRVVNVSLTGDDLNASFSSAGRTSNLAVRFGDEHELNIKAHALGALLGAESSGNVTAIDLTVPDAPVLRLSGAKG